MIAFIVVLVVLALLVASGIMSALDMRPEQRPPEWSVGGLIEARR